MSMIDSGAESAVEATLLRFLNSPDAETLRSIGAEIVGRIDVRIEAAAERAAARDAAADAREHALQRREAAVEVREREAEAKLQRAFEHEATISRRAADLQQRYSGAK